ncbi:MAG: hypothetical protein ACF8R7_09360 [Phycisphaerales bacterium JB039]
MATTHPRSTLCVACLSGAVIGFAAGVMALLLFGQTIASSLSDALAAVAALLLVFGTPIFGGLVGLHIGDRMNDRE